MPACASILEGQYRDRKIEFYKGAFEMVIVSEACRSILSILLGAVGCFSNLSHRFYSIIIIAMSSIILTACAQVKIEAIKPPAEQLVCSNEPSAPATINPATTAGYMLDLRAAWQDCFSRVQWHKDYWESQ